MSRACVIVLDAVGAGALPDASDYGDEGSDTLGNVAKAVGAPVEDVLEAMEAATAYETTSLDAPRPGDDEDDSWSWGDSVSVEEQGYELVYGIRSERDEAPLMRLTRRAYYRLISRLSYVAIPPDVGDFQLADRVVVNALRQIDDAYPFMRIMTFECGFKSVGVPYRWRRRRKGFSKNRLSTLVDQGLNGLITFSNAPLRLALYAGFLISMFSFIYAFATAIASLVLSAPVARGIPTLIVAIFFFGGVQLFVTGLIGEYLLAIYNQVRKKPLVIERERINF